MGELEKQIKDFIVRFAQDEAKAKLDKLLSEAKKEFPKEGIHPMVYPWKVDIKPYMKWFVKWFGE